MMRLMETRLCAHCTKPFVPCRHIQKFCNYRCKKAAHRRRYPERERERARKYRKSNPERVRESKRRFRAKNPVRFLEHRRKSRAKYKLKNRALILMARQLLNPEQEIIR